MDILYEVILDVVFELYDDLLSYFMPAKNFSKRVRVLIKLACALITIINVGLIFLGVWFILEKRLSLGITLTVVGGILILTHVILAIYLNIKTSRK